MLKPIYFPFTHISKPVFDGLKACFRHIIVYQPNRLTVPENLQRWSESGQIEVRIPVKGDEEKLATLLKDFKDWAKFHYEKQGLKDAFTRALRNPTPFFDEHSASQIKADIKGKTRTDDLRSGSDLLFNARVFLAMAQEFDLQTETLHRDLDLVGKMENDLMKSLQGDNGKAFPYAPKATEIIPPAIDSPDYMITERIKAWARLMLSDHHLDDEQNSGLFITSSRTALNTLLDNAAHVEHLNRFENIPMVEELPPTFESWQDHLMDTLKQLASTPWPGQLQEISHPPAGIRADNTVSLTFYLVPGETPRQFFSRFEQQEFSSTEEQEPASRFKNTLIAQIDTHRVM